MQPLLDMLKSADNGRAMDLLARQFDLTKQQAELAVEALLPAFGEGLKRNAADPFGLGAFMAALAGGHHAKTFEDAARAFTPAGMADGNAVLGQLFGSPDLSRAIAEQAAAMTGIGQDILKQMMPAVATMLMGGMARQAAAPENPFAELMRQMMQAGGASNTTANPFAANPFAAMFEAMVPGQRGATPERELGPGAGGSKAPAAGFYDLFGQMFETGRKGREDYEKAVGALFDRFGKGTARG